MRSLAGAVLLLSLALPTVALAQDAADLIVLNAVIHTMDVAVPTAQALAVRDGVILAVGDVASVERLRGPEARVIDAGGAVVLPGLIDAHGHVMGLGRALRLGEAAFRRWERRRTVRVGRIGQLRTLGVRESGRADRAAGRQRQRDMPLHRPPARPPHKTAVAGLPLVAILRRRWM